MQRPGHGRALANAPWTRVFLHFSCAYAPEAASFWVNHRPRLCDNAALFKNRRRLSRPSGQRRHSAMPSEEISKEERILRMMKKVLTDVAKDTHGQPGFSHPLSDNTIQGIRECLALIAGRERELVEARGKSMSMRPHFIDEPKKTVVVSLDRLKKNKPADDT